MDWDADEFEFLEDAVKPGKLLVQGGLVIIAFLLAVSARLNDENLHYDYAIVNDPGPTPRPTPYPDGWDGSWELGFSSADDELFALENLAAQAQTLKGKTVYAMGGWQVLGHKNQWRLSFDPKRRTVTRIGYAAGEGDMNISSTEVYFPVTAAELCKVPRERRPIEHLQRFGSRRRILPAPSKAQIKKIFKFP